MWLFSVLLLLVCLIGLQAAEMVFSSYPALVSGVSIKSPLNCTYTCDVLMLNVSSKTFQGTGIKTSFNFSIDGKNVGSIPTNTTFEPLNTTITYANGTTSYGPSIFSPNVTRGHLILPKLSSGAHNLTVYAKYVCPNTNRFVTPYLGTITYYDNSTVYFAIDLSNSVAETNGTYLPEFSSCFALAMFVGCSLGLVLVLTKNVWKNWKGKRREVVIVFLCC